MLQKIEMDVRKDITESQPIEIALAVSVRCPDKEISETMKF